MDYGAWGSTPLRPTYAPQALQRAPFKAPAQTPLEPVPERYLGTVRGSERSGALLAQHMGTSRNRYYVKLALIWTGARAMFRGALAFVQRDLQEHVSSQPRQNSQNLEKCPDRLSDSGSGPKEPPAPQVVRWSEQQEPGTWVIFIPEGGAFSACGRTFFSGGGFLLSGVGGGI